MRNASVIVKSQITGTPRWDFDLKSLNASLKSTVDMAFVRRWTQSPSSTSPPQQTQILKTWSSITPGKCLLPFIFRQLHPDYRDKYLDFTMQNNGITIITKKTEKYCSIKSNSCTLNNPKKYSCYGLKKIDTRNLITKKHSCGSKISLPPHNFSNGLSLKGTGELRAELNLYKYSTVQK